MCVYICAAPQLLTAGSTTAARARTSRQSPREAALLLSSTLGERSARVPFLSGSVISLLLTQQPAQEQSQQHNVTVENPVLQILLPSQPGLSLPLSDNTHMFMLTQPTTARVQLVAEQQLSGDDHGESLGGQEHRSHR